LNPLLPFFLLVTLLAGCSSASTRKVIELDAFRNIYVEQRLADNNHLDQIIVAELQRLGRVASSGPRTMMPDNTDAVLTYTDRWGWDFKTYLIEMNIELHTARTRKKLADCRYYQPSLKTKSPAEVIRELLVPLLGKSNG
jgi:hypothetical protein